MPAAPSSRFSAPATGRRLLVWLTLGVALVHLALLSGLPDMLAVFQPEATLPTRSFATRTIAPVPPAPTQPAAPVTSTPRAKRPRALPAPPQPTPPQPAQPADTPPAPLAEAEAEAAPAPAPGDSAPASQVASADANPVPGATPSGAPAAPGAPAATAGTDSAAEPPVKLAIPPSVRLLYDVNGVVTYAYTGGSELLWLNQGNGYSARLQITKVGFNLRTWTSKGDLTGQGLAPLRFGDRTRSEIAAHFQRDKGIVSFSANTPDIALLNGAQDYLSSFFQLAAMLAGEPQRYPLGSQIAFQVVNARSAEPWAFRVDGPETTPLPDGPKAAIKLTREHDAQYDTKVELWLAPDLSYVPVRIRLSQGNGDFAELLWRSAQKPE